MDDVDEETKRRINLAKLHKYTYGTTDDKKIEKAIVLIDDLIKSYENHHKAMVLSDQPDKVEVTQRTIDDLEKIKKILEE